MAQATGAWRVEGKIIAPDGSESEFSTSGEGYSQWGADRERLGRSVYLVQAMDRAVREYDEQEEEE